MNFLETLTLAIALGTDALSIAMVIGVQKYSNKDIFKISFLIALFHIFMPLLGSYGGNFIEKILLNKFLFENKIDKILNIIGSGLLLLIGFYMITEKWFNKDEKLSNVKLKGIGLIALAFSVSLDSFSIGVSLGMLGNINLFVVLIFGLMAGLMMALGLFLGSKIGHWFGEKAQTFGGIALVYLALHFAGLL